MKRAKLIGIGIGLVIVAILVGTNLKLFTTPIEVGIPYLAPKTNADGAGLPNVVFLGAFFALGFLLKFLLGLPGVFATRKAVKALNEEVRTLQTELAVARQDQAQGSAAGAAPGAGASASA